MIHSSDFEAKTEKVMTLILGVLLLLITLAAISINGFGIKRLRVFEGIQLMSREVLHPPGVALSHLASSRVLNSLGTLKVSSSFDVNGRRVTQASIIILADVSPTNCQEFYTQTKDSKKTLWQFNGRVFQGNPPLNLVCNFSKNEIAVKAT